MENYDVVISENLFEHEFFLSNHILPSFLEVSWEDTAYEETT